MPYIGNNVVKHDKCDHTSKNTIWTLRLSTLGREKYKDESPPRNSMYCTPIIFLHFSPPLLFSSSCLLTLGGLGGDNLILP